MQKPQPRSRYGDLADRAAADQRTSELETEQQKQRANAAARKAALRGEAAAALQDEKMRIVREYLEERYLTFMVELTKQIDERESDIIRGRVAMLSDLFGLADLKDAALKDAVETLFKARMRR